MYSSLEWRTTYMSPVDLLKKSSPCTEVSKSGAHYTNDLLKPCSIQTSSRKTVTPRIEEDHYITG